MLSHPSPGVLLRGLRSLFGAGARRQNFVKKQPWKEKAKLDESALSNPPQVLSRPRAGAARNRFLRPLRRLEHFSSSHRDRRLWCIGTTAHHHQSSLIQQRQRAATLERLAVAAVAKKPRVRRRVPSAFRPSF